MIKQKAVTILTVLFLSITSITFGQSDESSYLKFDYLKVKPDNVQQYMEYMRSTWMPLYQKQVDKGQISSWSLYRVFTPGGEKGSYNFITITSADGLDKYESMRPRDLLALSQESKDAINKMMTQANAFRSLQYTELWKTINKMQPEGDSPHEAKFLMIDYMMVSPGREYDYLMLEDEIAKPLHQERRNQDRMVGWELFDMITPSGSNYGYNFATGNYFNDLQDIEYGFTEDLIQSAMPGTDIPELFETIMSTRALVNSEVWELVDRTE